MRTLPLFSSVAQMPSGVVGDGAGAAATGAGCGAGAATGAGACGVTSTGAAVAAATVVWTGAAAAVATGAAGCGAAAWTGAGADFAGGGLETTSSSSSKFLDLKPLKLLRPGAEILMQDSDSQWRGASMRIFWPSISKEMPLLPAWAEVVAMNSAARMVSFFMRASLSGWFKHWRRTCPDPTLCYRPVL